MPSAKKLLIAAALLQCFGAVAEASPVTRTDTVGNVQTGAGTTTFSFDPITDASQLTSQMGTIVVSSNEGSTFDVVVDVDYVGGAMTQIFSRRYIANGMVLTTGISLSNLAFTPGTINGLSFVVQNLQGPFSFPPMVSVLPDTTFTFDAVIPTPPTGVPEPMSAALVGIGLAAAAARSRRRGRALEHPATRE